MYTDFPQGKSVYTWYTRPAGGGVSAVVKQHRSDAIRGQESAVRSNLRPAFKVRHMVSLVFHNDGMGSDRDRMHWTVRQFGNVAASGRWIAQVSFRDSAFARVMVRESLNWWFPCPLSVDGRGWRKCGVRWMAPMRSGGRLDASLQWGPQGSVPGRRAPEPVNLTGPGWGCIERGRKGQGGKGGQASGQASQGGKGPRPAIPVPAHRPEPRDDGYSGWRPIRYRGQPPPEANVWAPYIERMADRAAAEAAGDAAGQPQDPQHGQAPPKAEAVKAPPPQKAMPGGQAVRNRVPPIAGFAAAATGQADESSESSGSELVQGGTWL